MHVAPAATHGQASSTRASELLLQLQLNCGPGNVMIFPVNWEEREEKLSLSL